MMNRTGIFAVALGLMLSGCAGGDLFVVLPHEDGSTGSVVVHQNGRDTVLDKPLSAVKAGDANAFTIASSDVDQRFGKAISSLPPAARSYMLYFKLNSVKLEPESVPVMADMYKDVAGRAAAEIMVIGHTDKVGKITDNDQLALRRAQTIAAYLVEKGTPRDKVIAAGRGEREPLVPTADEVTEPLNRRVEISVR